MPPDTILRHRGEQVLEAISGIKLLCNINQHGAYHMHRSGVDVIKYCDRGVPLRYDHEWRTHVHSLNRAYVASQMPIILI